MKLLEIEGKKLFKKAGITVPRDVLISSVKDISKIFAPCIVKAQVLHGHRGQQGLMKKYLKKCMFSLVCKVEKNFWFWIERPK